MPQRTTIPEPARILAELTDEDRDWLERWCILVGVPRDGWLHVPALARVVAAQAAAGLVRRLRATGHKRESAIREAGARLGVSWRTIECWLTRWPEEAIRARARAALPRRYAGNSAGRVPLKGPAGLAFGKEGGGHDAA